MEKTKGVWIPAEILQMENLTSTEKIVYAYYLQLTKNAEKHQAIATNEQIAETLGIPFFQFRDRIKPALKKKGLISAKGIATKAKTNHRQSVDATQQEETNDHRQSVETNHRQSVDAPHRQSVETKQEEKQEIKKEIYNKTTVVTGEKKLDFGKSCFEGKKQPVEKTTQIPSEEETMDWMLDGEKLTQEKHTQTPMQEEATNVQWEHPDGGDFDEWVESVRWYRIELRRAGIETPRIYNPENLQHLKEKQIINAAPVSVFLKQYLQEQLFSTDTTAA